MELGNVDDAKYWVTHPDVVVEIEGNFIFKAIMDLGAKAWVWLAGKGTYYWDGNNWAYVPQGEVVASYMSAFDVYIGG
jgi:hypothetical protein